MANETIMIIEDEADIRELLRCNLTREGYSVAECASAEEAQEGLKKKVPDLIMLDLMLPGTDGVAFCRWLRASERTAKVPIMMVTARNEDADIEAGLEVGADDYITKPFSPRILSTRVRSMLRRQPTEPEASADLLRRGPFEVDRTRHVVMLEGVPLTLTLSEFKALELFLRRPGIVFSRYQIVDAVHGEDYSVTDRSVDVLIVGLRKKLGKYSDIIETVRGVGYRMRAR